MLELLAQASQPIHSIVYTAADALPPRLFERVAPWSLTAAALAFAIAIGEAIVAWRRRRKPWPDSFEHLATHSRPPIWMMAAVTLLSLIALAPCIESLGHSPALRAALVALACATVGQRSGILAFNELALLVAWGGCIALGVVLVGESDAGSSLVIGIPTLQMLILAIYWSRQLRDGVGWTTAGRLAPSARALAVIGSLILMLGGFIWHPNSAAGREIQPAWIVFGVFDLGSYEPRTRYAGMFAVVLIALLALFVFDFVRNRRLASLMGLTMCGVTAVVCARAFS